MRCRREYKSYSQSLHVTSQLNSLLLHFKGIWYICCSPSLKLRLVYLVYFHNKILPNAAIASTLEQNSRYEIILTFPECIRGILKTFSDRLACKAIPLIFKQSFQRLYWKPETGLPTSSLPHWNINISSFSSICNSTIIPLGRTQSWSLQLPQAKSAETEKSRETEKQIISEKRKVETYSTRPRCEGGRSGSMG